MKNGSAAIAPYYAGDYMTMYDSNDLLGFYYPEEGTNVFVDAMCVPACAKNKELAEQYINFMLEKEIAVANAEYIGYASPHTLVREDEEYIAYMEDWHEDAMEILYAENSGVKTEYYESLDADTLSLQNGLWESLKIENSVEPWIYITSSTIVGALLLLFLYNFLLKKYRNKY